MAFKITPVETYDAAYPRRRANTAATSRRISRWRWLLTVVLGVFLALFSSACGDDNNDDGKNSGEDSAWDDHQGIPDTEYSDGDEADVDDDEYDSTINEYAGISDAYDDVTGEEESEADSPDAELPDIDSDIDDWDVLEGDNHPMDPDPPMETEVDAVDQWDDAWEQPDKPGPDGDEDAEPELEEEEYVLEGDMAAYRYTK